MKKLTTIILLICAQLGFGQNALLTWQKPTTQPYRVDIFKTNNITAPVTTWPLYLTINNTPTNNVLVPVTNACGFFIGRYSFTNYTVLTNAVVSTNLIVNTNTFSTNIVNATSVTLAWDASSTPSVSGYKVYLGPATRNYTNSYGVGIATTFTVGGLVSPWDYFFAATAYDTNGIESDYSNEIDWKNYTGTTNVTYTTNTVYTTNYTFVTNSTTASSSLALSILPIIPPSTPRTNTFSFTNASGLTIRDNTTATPFPWTISVSGVTGTVDKVTISLNGITHAWSGDIDIMVSSPSNQTVLLMSDCGNGSHLTNANFTFDSTALSILNSNGVPALVSGTYKPSNYTENWQPIDSFPGAPAPVNTNTLAIFNNTNPNGTWALWVVDDGPNDAGSIVRWSLSITTHR
jgi:subtilisin-like proprotein convertase family protein